VDLVHPGEPPDREGLCGADGHRPEMPMDTGDPAVDEPAYEAIAGVAQRTRAFEWRVAPRMGPPDPANRRPVIAAVRAGTAPVAAPGMTPCLRTNAIA
jgi:hypothetical protein